MKNPRLLEYIPFHPKGISEEYLAIKAGYVKPPFKNTEKGLNVLKKDLQWLTMKHPELVQQTLKMQITTEEHLKQEKYPIPQKEEWVYISRFK